MKMLPEKFLSCFLLYSIRLCPLRQLPVHMNTMQLIALWIRWHRLLLLFNWFPGFICPDYNTGCTCQEPRREAEQQASRCRPRPGHPQEVAWARPANGQSDLKMVRNAGRWGCLRRGR